MLSDVVGREVRAARRAARLSREQVAERCATFGWTAVTASVVNYIETGRPDADGKRRREVTVDELAALAFVLDIPPLALLAPLSDEPWQGLPDALPRRASTADAIAWLRGDRRLIGSPSLDRSWHVLKAYVDADAAAHELHRLLGEWQRPAPATLDEHLAPSTDAEGDQRPPGWDLRYTTALGLARTSRLQLRAMNAPLPALPPGLEWVDSGGSHA